jgi:hypothetical protein
MLGTFFANVTGNGFADAIVVNNDTITVRPDSVRVVDPPPPTGTLSGGFFFEASAGYQPFSMTVIFTGTLRGGSSADVFRKEVTQQIVPGIGPRSVTFSVNGLKRGTWDVTAIPTAVAAPKACSVVVPGIVYLNVYKQPSCSAP